MEHPPKQGLKLEIRLGVNDSSVRVLMEHPPKQGLKLSDYDIVVQKPICFNGTSTKTRIETQNKQITTEEKERF